MTRTVITLKSARDWYASLSDEALRNERAHVLRLMGAGMADGADLRCIDAELTRRAVA